MNRQIVLIVHNVRSCHNVGSLLRTADGLGITKVYLTGYTPYPAQVNDERLPHLRDKIDRQIHKTALGAEHSVKWENNSDIVDVLNNLRKQNYVLCALEQTKKSLKLSNFQPPGRTALLVGREVEGIEEVVLKQMDEVLEIPMLGNKESFNVAIAAAIALYHLRFNK